MRYLTFVLAFAVQLASAQLQVGDSVAVGPQAVDCTTAHTTASTTGPALKCENVGQRGKIVTGPSGDVNGSSANTFWNVAFTDAITGWVVEKNLTKISSAPPVVLHQADSVVVSTSGPCVDVYLQPLTTIDIYRCYPNGTVGWIVEGPATDTAGTGIVFWHVWWADSTLSWCSASQLAVTKPFPLVAGQLPTATFSAYPTSVSTGQSVVTFKWTTQNATFVDLQGWPGYRNLNDSVMVSITYSQTVTLIATNAYGMVQIPITIPVMTPPPPVLAFAVGTRVAVEPNTRFLNVRSVPSLTGNYPLGTEATAQQGLISAGPTVASGYNWWQVMWDDGKKGWSAQPYLVTIPVEPPLPYPSVKNTYDSLLITTSGSLQPILIQGMYVRRGCADTLISIVPCFWVERSPSGRFDTTDVNATYHFTKRPGSVER